MGFFDQAKMIAQARRLQKELASTLIEVEKLEGKIKVIIDGTLKVNSIHLDENINLQEAETYLKEAVNEALLKAQRKAAEKMSELGGFNLPPI